MSEKVKIYIKAHLTNGQFVTFTAVMYKTSYDVLKDKLYSESNRIRINCLVEGFSTTLNMNNISLIQTKILEQEKS